MLKKIIGIKNVGRFRNSAASGNPQLAKHTLIAGANGYGKTTICAILRSLQTGDAAHVLGRKTLGVTGQATVELLLDTGNVRFDGTAWTGTLPSLAIFDGTFVAENVYSGEVVEIDQKRNLYRVIIGREGVQLAETEAGLSAASKTKTSEISTAAKTLQPFIPLGMKLETFIALPADQDIDAKIEGQQRTLEALKLAGQIKARPPFSEITLPTMPAGLSALLAKTIDDIATDAEQQLAQHLTANKMVKDGETWIAEGMTHVSGESCPFCGQDIQELPLIAAYRAVFSDSYKKLKTQIAAAKNQVSQLFGEVTIGRLNTLAELNRGAGEFWGRYCSFDASPLSIPEETSTAILKLGQDALALIDRKASAPLEVISPDDAFNESLAAYEAVQARAIKVNTAIQSVNAIIAAKKIETGAADVKAAEATLAGLHAVKKRHEEEIGKACSDWVRLTAEKEAIEKQKASVRARLEAHTRQVVEPYENRINNYLDSFNAGFRISETKHGYPGGVPTSSYQLVINSTPINLGDGRTPAHTPSFKNTLSAGDRTTLALAFFLAHLELDPEPGRKIAVFDDPFNSQDAFRRRQTVYEIMKAGRICAQVIVLSHDATFLKQIWEKAPSSDRVSLQISDARAQGTKIHEIDLDKACQGRMACEIDDLQAYLATGAGGPLDHVKKIRVVLETYCRTTYPACFCATDWLGDIISKVRDDADHPAFPLYDELDQINDYTKQYHHGEDVADTTPDQIDAAELTGYVRRTLRVVNALQA